MIETNLSQAVRDFPEHPVSERRQPIWRQPAAISHRRCLYGYCDTLSQNLAATHTEGYRLASVGVLALNHQRRNAVDVGVEMAKLAEQGALSDGVEQVELLRFGIKYVVKEGRTIHGVFLGWRIRIKLAPLLSFFTGHNHAADGPGVFENTGLDGFVFGGSGYVSSNMIRRSQLPPLGGLDSTRRTIRGSEGLSGGVQGFRPENNESVPE